jgi:hypothetical protein
VRWLKAEDRGQWAELIVAAVAPLVSNKASAL